ncbi:MAG TPA: hypothetical protein VNA69_06510 [Thermoanaerobaculia bacterium]|nr:hypothetical protein [Thermoanaerobaculia bacterium]
MIIGEVKEGRVGINSGICDPEVLKAVVSRFGKVTDVHGAVHQLLQHGAVHIPPSSSVRLLAFGSFPPGSQVPPCRIISLGHVLLYLQNYVRRHWHILRHMQFKDPAFGFLMTLEKARRGAAGRRGEGRRGEAGVEIVPSQQQKRCGMSGDAVRSCGGGGSPPVPSPRVRGEG